MRESQENAAGVDTDVSIIQTGVGDVVKHGFGIDVPFMVEHVSQTKAALQGKFEGLTDQSLVVIRMNVTEDDTGTDLEIGNQVVRLLRGQCQTEILCFIKP